MANTFWIKLFLQILDDPKMGNLSDRLYRRTIEMFLLAGDNDKNGILPSEQDISWRLRIGNEPLHTEITELIEKRILDLVDGELHVKNFEKWQGEIKAKERMKHYRDLQKKHQYYGNETNRNTDKIRIDKNKQELDIDDPKVYRRYTKGKNGNVHLHAPEVNNG